MNGNLLDYFFVFGSGVLVSFTPCIYPVIPLVISFIGGASTNATKTSGFVISSVYVLGLAITYCSLAVFASLSGRVFGEWQNYPIFFIIVANVLIFFSLAMLDVIPVNTWGITRENKSRPKNLWAVLVAGMSSGLVIGPCATPVLAGILVFISSKRNVLYGTSLMFVFSLGLGASLILVGTFSGLLASLPKSGQWMLWIKRFCGIVLLLAAEFYLIKAGTLFF